MEETRISGNEGNDEKSRNEEKSPFSTKYYLSKLYLKILLDGGKQNG